MFTVYQKRDRVPIPRKNCCCFNGIHSTFWSVRHRGWNMETLLHVADQETGLAAENLPWAGKVIVTVFWRCQGIVFVESLEKGGTITGRYYVSLLPIKQRVWILHSNFIRWSHCAEIVVAPMFRHTYQLIRLICFYKKQVNNLACIITGLMWPLCPSTSDVINSGGFAEVTVPEEIIEIIYGYGVDGTKRAYDFWCRFYLIRSIA